jgi:hypothetical protein
MIQRLINEFGFVAFVALCLFDFVRRTIRRSRTIQRFINGFGFVGLYLFDFVRWTIRRSRTRFINGFGFIESCLVVFRIFRSTTLKLRINRQ